MHHTEQEVRAKFESAYGLDSMSRTPEQWRHLVKVYGIGTVSEKENMTIEEVTSHCHEPYRDYLKRQFKNKK